MTGRQRRAAIVSEEVIGENRMLARAIENEKSNTSWFKTPLEARSDRRISEETGE